MQYDGLTIEVIETISLEEIELPCQGVHHAEGLNGHVPEQPASWLLICPNCGPDFMHCQGRVDVLAQKEYVICGNCRVRSPWGKWGKFPVGRH